MKNWISFEREGINAESNLPAKLWRISRILNRSPFDDYVLSLTAVEMDFMLEMFAKDHPNEYTFKKQNAEPEPKLFTYWTDKLFGKTLTEFSKSPVAYFKKYFK